MSHFHVEIVPCGSPCHLTDLRSLGERGLAIPHDYSTWPLHCTLGSWSWCRLLDGAERLVTGFAVNLTLSRAIPGTRIGRIDRVGRNLHEEVADMMGAVLSEVARKIPRLLRLDVRVFDEDPLRRRTISDSLAAAGWSLGPERRQYSRTLVLPLGTSHAEVLKGFSTRVRSAIKKSLSSPAVRFAPIVGRQYADRIRYLHTLPFERTGGTPPRIDANGILGDSASRGSSLLMGVFTRDGRPPPQDLAALLWGRLHGDNVVVEITASERSALFDKISPGFGLMSELIAWSIQHNAQWIDMGGLACLDPAPNDPLRGIIEFKSRFSTDLRTVAEEWNMEPSPLLAAAAEAVRSIARPPKRA